jgi:hypothetical protein
VKLHHVRGRYPEDPEVRGRFLKYTGCRKPI